MARTAKSTKTRKPAIKAIRSSRDAASASATRPQPKVQPAASKKVKTAKTVTAPATPRLSVGELRAQLEKLQNANATLRAKNREANRAAKTAAARIAELEEEVAQLQKESAPQPAPKKRGSAATRAKRQSLQIDPGDAVPPGVAVEEPAPLDDEAETALENLEAHLTGD